MDISAVRHCSITRYAGTDYEETITGKTVIATIDGEEVYVPIDPLNRHYIAVQEWVAEGNTIADAE